MQQNSALKRRPHYATPTSRKPVYKSLVRHRPTTCFQHATPHCLHRLLHPRPLFTKKKVLTVKLITRSNSHQLDNRLQRRQYSRNSKTFENRTVWLEKTLIKPMSRKIFFKQRTQHHEMFNTNACGLRIIEPWTFSINWQSTLTAWGIMDISPTNQPFLNISPRPLQSWGPTPKTHENRWNSGHSKHHTRYWHELSRSFFNTDPQGKYWSHTRRHWRQRKHVSFSTNGRISGTL